MPVMLSNRLAFISLAVACIAAAAGGGYVATRQNVIPAPATAVALPAPVAGKPVHETEAATGAPPNGQPRPANPAPAAAPPSSPAASSSPVLSGPAASRAS